MKPRNHGQPVLHLLRDLQGFGAEGVKSINARDHGGICDVTQNDDRLACDRICFLAGAGRGLGPRRLWRWRFSWRWLRWRRFPRRWLRWRRLPRWRNWSGWRRFPRWRIWRRWRRFPRRRDRRRRLSFGSDFLRPDFAALRPDFAAAPLPQQFPRRLRPGFRHNGFNHRQFPIAAAAIGVGVGYGLYGSY